MDNTLVQLINELLAAQADVARLQQENALLRAQLLGGEKPSEDAPSEPAKDSA